ncbi:MAG TPA: hypothetical protein VF253_14485 [Candidatus Limnocylindrales bacterium]|jgi:hypothetical protein
MAMILGPGIIIAEVFTYVGVAFLLAVTACSWREARTGRTAI